jgi:PAS domain S-box-containing protein
VSEATWAESTDALMQVINGLLRCVLVCRADGEVLFANEAARQTFGNASHTDLAHKLGLPEAPQEPTTVDYRNVRGEACVGEVHALRTAFRGKPAYVLSIGGDEAAANTRAQLNMLSQALDATPECIVIANPEGRIQYVNEAMVKLTGLGREELLGEDFRMLAGAGHTTEFFQAIQAQVDRGEPWTGDIVHRHKDGHEYDLRVTLSPVTNAAGAVINLVATCEDVTEEKERTERMRHAQRLEAIGTLAAGIAHDFNNSLNIISGYTEFVMNTLPLHSQEQQDLHEVMQAAHRAGELVRQVLEFAREQESTFQRLQLALLVKEVAKFLHMTYPANVEVRLQADTGDAHIWGDLTQLHQLLLNLCNNARDALPKEGGVIEISLYSVSGNDSDHEKAGLDPDVCYLVLAIRDNGCGMTPETCEHALQPFFTTKPMNRGAGLGLWNVQQIVSTHGGAIALDSQLDAGTCVRVYFPHLPEDAVEIDFADQSRLPRGHGERVLMLDDEPSIASLLERVLSSLGYQVTPFTDPRKAWNCIEAGAEPIDVVITDHMMPAKTGLEIAIKLHEHFPAVPVIIFTGFSERLDPDTLKAAKISKLLFKPLNTAQIAHAVAQVLKSKRAAG